MSEIIHSITLFYFYYFLTCRAMSENIYILMFFIDSFINIYFRIMSEMVVFYLLINLIIHSHHYSLLINYFRAMSENT